MTVNTKKQEFFCNIYKLKDRLKELLDIIKINR